MKNTKVTVTVKYEMVVEGDVPADDIDIKDVIRDINAIRDIKIKTKVVICRPLPTTHLVNPETGPWR